VAKLRSGIDVDRVREVAAAMAAHVVVLEVLHERATERDVDHLLAAADAEDRKVYVARLLEQSKLRLVQVPVDRPDLLVLLLSVEGGVDVPASGEEKPIEVGQRASAGRELDRLSACGLHRPKVRLVVGLAALRADRDPDLWFVYRVVAPAGAALPMASSSASILASSSAEPWTFGPLNQFLADSSQ